MLILLPPSEGKAQPTRGKPLNLAALGSPELDPERRKVLRALVDLCSGPPDIARSALGIPESMNDWVHANADVESAPTAVARRIYTGVLYAALDLAGLDGTDLRRANRRLVTVSALFGLVGPSERIPAYRLNGAVRLPGIGGLAPFWREPLTAAVVARSGSGLIVDMLSTPYAAMWSVPSGSADRTVAVKVWQRTPAGARVAVSHNNKSTKGRLARDLAVLAEVPKRPEELVDVLEAQGWDVGLTLTSRAPRLDVYSQV